MVAGKKKALPPLAMRELQGGKQSRGSTGVSGRWEGKGENDEEDPSKRPEDNGKYPQVSGRWKPFAVNGSGAGNASVL